MKKLILTTMLACSLLNVNAYAQEMKSVGTFKLTFYCPCKKCSGPYGYQTSSGAKCTEGRTVATDYFPAGTKIYIEGYGYRIVEDTGVHGRHLDVFMESHSECLKHGEKYKEVFLIND